MFCRLSRFMISSAADSGRATGWWTSRHVARCTSCRRFLESCREIDVRLRSEAAAWRRVSMPLSGEIPPNLVELPSPRRGRPIRAVLAAAACVAVMGIAAILLSMPARRPEAPTSMERPIIPLATPWATKWAGLIENPLTAEAQRLTSDAESGIRFVVACLDVRPLGLDTSVYPREPARAPSQ